MIHHLACWMNSKYRVCTYFVRNTKLNALGLKSFISLNNAGLHLRLLGIAWGLAANKECCK